MPLIGTVVSTSDLFCTNPSYGNDYDFCIFTAHNNCSSSIFHRKNGKTHTVAENKSHLFKFTKTVFLTSTYIFL